MNRIEIIDPAKDPRWDEFVKTHPYGQVYHLSAWKNVLEDSFPHMKGFYYVLLDESGTSFKAALPIYSVKSWIMGNRLVSIPYATIFDPLIDNTSDFDILFKRVCLERLEKRKMVTEIRAFNADLSQLNQNFLVYKTHKYHFLNIDDDLKNIKKKFHKKSVKSAINRSLKTGMSIRMADDMKSLLEFYQLYVLTRKRLCIPPQPYRYFKNIWLNLHQRGMFEIMFASYNGKSIAALGYFKYKGKVSTEFAGWDTKFHSFKPNHFLYWNAIKRSHDEGYKIFDFGRTSNEDNGLMNFKDRWGTTRKEITVGFYPSTATNRFEGHRSSVKIDIIKTISKHLPLRVFKLFGDFCYSHMG